jgi:two-component system sensor histidine kinase BarA
LLTLVPTTIIGLCIAGYFSYSRYVELDETLLLRSNSIIESMAIASLAPITNEDHQQSQQLVSFSHRTHSDIVKSIIIFNKEHDIFATSAYHQDSNNMRIKAGEKIPHNTQIEPYDDHYIFRSPIIDETQLLAVIDDQKNNPIFVGYIVMKVDREKVIFAQHYQIAIAVSIVLIGTFISLIFTIALIRNVTVPIASIVAAVDNIRQGKLTTRVEGHLVGELSFLQNGVNAMAQSLSDYNSDMQRDIEQTTIDLRESLEQLEIQNVELDLSKRQAQEANRVKSEFLANMSHELRTPLNGVIGFTRQVLKTPLSETQRDHLQIIEGSADNLLTLINDILDFSKLDAGKMIIEKIPFALKDTIEETITLLAPSAHKKNIDLSLRFAQNMPNALIGDAMRIKQVLINLVSNAIKFTEKGFVCIDINACNIDHSTTEFKISVTDTGIAITKEQQKSIFEAFEQADKSITRLYGGSGLGLVISQRLAIEMQGDIGFTSEQNQGSTFWFTFRVKLDKQSATISDKHLNLCNKRVLYFEPLEHSRIATSEIMAAWKMQVISVANLKQLNEILVQKKAFDFALISQDLTPSTISQASALVSSIKQQIPVIHLALNSQSANLQEVLIASGASSCLSKPVTSKSLLRALLPEHKENIRYLSELHDHKIAIKVLAVDDNQANLKLIKTLLLEQVAEVSVANNGQQALELCEKEKFSLIFMDIQMPIMDGLSALKAIKLQGFNDSTPIIAVTAHAIGDEKEKFLLEGFSAYISKPLDEAMLRHSIYEYCDSHLLNALQLPPASNTLPDISRATPATLNWSIALQRSGNNPPLAIDMLQGLVDALAETKQQVSEALQAQDAKEVNSLIHKLNGACCYTGAPNLEQISRQLEISITRGASLDALEPEFSEFFEHLDNLAQQAPLFLEELQQVNN